jgi:hypothetical protein
MFAANSRGAEAMTHPHPRALEAAARAAMNAWEAIPDCPGKMYGQEAEVVARAAVSAYLQSAPPEIRIGQFVIRHAPKGIWIGRPGGEGGEFPTQHVEDVIAQFYRANF